MGAVFAFWAQPFPFWQTQPLPVGNFTQKNKQNQPTELQGGKKNKNIRVSHVVSEDPTLITTCLLVVSNKVKTKKPEPWACVNRGVRLEPKIFRLNLLDDFSIIS